MTMNTPYDELVAPLADAALTSEERGIWEDRCAQLLSANARINELERRIDILKEQIKSESPLQTILTRPDFNREVARILALDSRYGTNSSVLYFDIENLESIKNCHGQEVADDIMAQICNTLMDKVRRTDIIGRLAPDEFGVLLPRCNNENAWRKGEQLALEIHHPLTENRELSMKPELSFGAYTFTDQEDVQAGIKKAAETVTKLQK